VAKLNPYIRIIRAAEKKVGVRLSPEEVQYLAFDDAIASVAANTLEGVAVDGGAFHVYKHGFKDKGENNG
jgi:hypothetical protein